MENYIWIGAYVVVFMAFFVAAWVVDEPKTKTRIGIIAIAAVLWPVALLAMAFVKLME